MVQRQRPDTTERDVGVEAAVLAEARRVGVPVPPLVGCVTDTSGTTSLVTRHVAGETIARRILRDDRFASARDVLTRELGEAIGHVHTIDASAVPGLEHTDSLAATRDRLDELGQPHPAFELAMRWLDDHRPVSSGRVGSCTATSASAT